MQINISTKQNQTHRYREQICGCQGGVGVGERRNGSLGLADANYYHIGWINNKVLLYSTGNYIQYPVTNHGGEEYGKECIYV